MKDLSTLQEERLKLLAEVSALHQESAREEASYQTQRAELVQTYHEIKARLDKESAVFEAQRSARQERLAALHFQLSENQAQLKESARAHSLTLQEKAAQRDREGERLLWLLGAQLDIIAPLLQQTQEGQEFLAAMRRRREQRATPKAAE